MLNTYMVTFGVDLSHEVLKRIEDEFHIPAVFEVEHIEARSPKQAMKIFAKEHKIERKIKRCRKYKDNLYGIYILRPMDCSWYIEYKLKGLAWNRDFNYLQEKKTWL